MIINKDNLIGAAVGAGITAVLGGSIYGVVKAIKKHKDKKKINELKAKLTETK